jgi:hypothetical protein
MGARKNCPNPCVQLAQHALFAQLTPVRIAIFSSSFKRNLVFLAKNVMRLQTITYIDIQQEMLKIGSDIILIFAPKIGGS